MTHIRRLLVPCLVLLGACGEDDQTKFTVTGDTSAPTDTAAPVDTVAPADSVAPADTVAPVEDSVADSAAEVAVDSVAVETVEDVADVAEEVAGPACRNDALAPQAAGLWYADPTAFAAAVGDTTLLDFEHRGDGVTPVTPGMAVPADEYVACCGVRLTLEGADADQQLIWAGNAVNGFTLRAQCANPDLCSSTFGIRVELVAPVGAISAIYAGNIRASVYDPDGGLVSTYTLDGSGESFAGYASDVPLGVATFIDAGGEALEELRLRPCD